MLNEKIKTDIIKQGLSSEVGEKIMTIAERFKQKGVTDMFRFSLMTYQDGKEKH